jgi:hypothetical protein
MCIQIGLRIQTSFKSASTQNMPIDSIERLRKEEEEEEDDDDDDDGADGAGRMTHKEVHTCIIIPCFFFYFSNIHLP